jgi:hypothetical protein
MIKVELNEGDEVWFFAAYHSGKMSKGRIAKVVNIPGYNFDHYIIAITTHIDEVFDIRSPYEVSDDPEKPIGFWRKG